jgi:hypothetical protein
LKSVYRKRENLQILFLVNDQREAHIIFCTFISIYNSLHASSTSCSSSGETNCINTASGNSHSMLAAEMCAGWKFTFNHRKTLQQTRSYKCQKLCYHNLFSPDDERWALETCREWKINKHI